MTRWAINGRFLTQPQTGVQRYAREITGALDALLAADERRAARLRWELIVPGHCEDLPALQAIAVRRTGPGRGHLWEQAVLPVAARGGGLVSLANLGPLAHPRQIVCMHDANVFLEPASYSRKFRAAYQAGLPMLARRARAVTTVSTFSATMLARHGVVGPAPCPVIGNGHEHALRWNASRSAYAAPGRFARPFVFALGSRARHKRLDLLLDLAPALDARGLDLVISGGSAAIFAETRRGMPRNVHAVGFVGDDDLAALFQRALCFAFPSRTEGFGLPLLEAMVHGAPIVAAGTASLPEVCGEAALYADDPAAWLAAIDRLAGDDALRADLRAKGYARCPQFSWRTSAEAYLDLAERLSLAPAGRAAYPAAGPIRPAA